MRPFILSLLALVSFPSIAYVADRPVPFAPGEVLTARAVLTLSGVLRRILIGIASLSHETLLWVSALSEAIEMPGSVDGMNSSEPSSRGGMNSRPIPGKVWTSRVQAVLRVGSAPTAYSPAPKG